jgi:hypothetical protein
MEMVSEWAKKIRIKVTKGKEEIHIDTSESFSRLTEALRDYNIFKESTLEYLNDFGDKMQITDDKSYFEFLVCSNGFFHYLDCKVPAIASYGSKEQEFYDENSQWKCICCHYENKPQVRQCWACSTSRL